MLETHFINHLELMQVKHSANEEVVPDQTGEPLAISRDDLNASIIDRAGRDISSTVRASDSDVFSTVDARLASVTAEDLDDYIDITVDAPATQDTVALELDMFQPQFTELSEPFIQLLERTWVEAIEAALRIDSRLDKPGFAKHA